MLIVKLWGRNPEFCSVQWQRMSTEVSGRLDPDSIVDIQSAHPPTEFFSLFRLLRYT